MHCAASCDRYATDVGPRGPSFSIVEMNQGQQSTSLFSLSISYQVLGGLKLILTPLLMAGVQCGLHDILKTTKTIWPIMTERT